MQKPSFLGRFLSLLLFTAAACTNDEWDHEADGNDQQVSFVLSVYQEDNNDTRATENGTWGDTYNSNTTQYDAAINPGTVCAYLVDKETGEQLFRVENLKCYKVSDEIYQYYGVVPKSSNSRIEDKKEYRCMVVANANVTAADATFSQSSLPGPNTSTDYTIPMWGVTTFAWDRSTDAQKLGTILMLRAAVKCRIRFSEDLVKEGYTLGDVTLHVPTTEGYLYPNGYNAVDYTSQLYYVDQESTEETVHYGFRPYTSSENVGGKSSFWVEPVVESTTKTESVTAVPKIVYFPEQKNDPDNPAYFEVDILKNGEKIGTKEGVFKDYTTNVLYTDLQRNHVYDYVIVGVGGRLVLTQIVSDWEQETEEWDYTTQISGLFNIDWNKDTYYQKLDDTKQIILDGGLAVSFNFTINSPIGASWYASITMDQADAFVIEQENSDSASASSSVSGTINGTKTNLIIRATNAENNRQHSAELSVYVRYANGTVRKIDELSGWKIVQRMR